MVPEFEEVAFSLDKGVISEPVLSDFGYHIIRVDEIREEHGKEYELVKEEIVNLLKQQKADEVFYDKSELLANETYENPDSLVPAAEAGGFTVQESDWIDRLSNEGIAANSEIINAALTPEVLTDGNNSQLLELGTNHVVVLRVKEHEEPRLKSFDEVKDEITSQLKDESASEMLEETATNALEKLKAGEQPEAVASEYSGELIPDADLTRDSTELDASLINALFSMPKPNKGSSTFSVVETSAGDRNIIALNAVKDGPESETDSPDSLLNATQSGNAEYGALLRELRSKALVEINQQVLQPETLH